MRRSSTTRWLLGALAFAPVAGCLVVTPLDDLPSQANNTTNHGGSSSGGSTNTNGATSGDAGAAGEASAGQPPVDSSCQTNAECVKRASDEPARCRPSDHQCVKLRTPECPVVYGKVSSPNAVYFGAFATLDRAVPEDNSIAWAHELAIDELSGDNIGGLPGPNKTRRPLVMVLCDNSSSVTPGLDHLIRQVEVPAIIATLQPGDLRQATEDFSNSDVFYLSPVSDTTTIESIDPNDHIWTLLGEPRDYAPAYAALLELAEKHVRGQQTDEQKQVPLRVALVTTQDAFDSELTQAVTPVLHFNGKSLAENGDDFFSMTIVAKPNFEQMAQDLAAGKPDIVISTAGDPFVMTNGLEQALEENWGVIAPDKPRPFYILSPYNAGRLTDLLKRVSARLERDPKSQDQQRYVGVSIASAPDNTLQNAYGIRLGAQHKGALTDTANYYDATYFLAYAMYGANQPAGLTGTGIAQGMHRLLDGDTFKIGPDDINATFEGLDISTSVHLQSTLGPPDFDPETGVRPVDGSVFCVDREGTSVSVKLKNDVLRYDRTAQKLVGTDFPCISGFFQP